MNTTKSLLLCRGGFVFSPVCTAGQMVAPLCADAGPVVDQAFGLPADHVGPLRLCSRLAAQQDQVGVRETDQSRARGGGPHQEGESKRTSGLLLYN